ncbi:MAG: flagellar basal-body rod protein FlgG [Halanaerobiaceae bacterium]
MISALWTSATGMEAQQSNIDVTSNNLSNVNTSGFKRSRTGFEDLMYQNIRQPGSPNAQGEEIPVGIEIGHGTKVASTQKLFEEGDVQNTENPLDVLIEGDGFLEVTLPDGSQAYTRDGSLKQDSEGRLVTSEGYRISPEITLPEDTEDISIQSDGTVNVKRGEGDETETVGQLELFRFANDAGLNSIGRNLYQQTESSGEPIFGAPGEEGLGTINQGFLEKSNVEVVEEMTNMIAAQRAYDVNSKSIKAADEMLQTANQLRR